MDSHPDLVVDLASFAAGVDPGALDGAVIEAAKTNLVDTLSCALAGSSAPGVAEVRDLVTEWGGAPQADVWVFGGKAPAHHAAWLNSALAHARDYDDTHDAAILHAGVSTVPAAIAAAQLRGGVSGADLIAAVVAGLEVTCRLGVAIEVDIIESGFIYSSLLGYFGATAAAGRAMGLSAQTMADALGIVYSSVAGNHQVTRDASLMKRLQPGLAAQAAVTAVQLAARGIAGPRGVFNGADGFFRVYLQGRADTVKARAGLGERFEFLNLSYKPYPCCRDTHAAIDATLELQRELSLDAEDVEAIRVGVTGPGYQMVCVPEAVRAAPRTIVEAQFSVPYAVATTWIDGRPSLSNFTEEGIDRSDVLELAARVTPYVDEDIDRDWRRFVTPARVVVELRDGRQFERRVDYPKGHPTNRMSADEFAAKAADCAGYASRALPTDIADRLTAAVLDLERIGDVSELVALMS
jgi:2-methylcitrate dehydratase PrpD